MNLLSIRNLRVEFGSAAAPLIAVNNVDLSIGPGEVVGLVGESGSGKSLTCRSIMRLIGYPGKISGGEIFFEDQDVLRMTTSELRTFRSKKVGMIFQDPFSSLNPVVRVGAQIGETLRLNVGCDRSEAKLKAIELLDSVGIPRPRERYRAYPHELSGGMRQRVMIALATASGPRLLLADEPTTALDVTTQKQILELLSQMRQDLGMAMLIVSHDFGVIAQMCDRVTVMYGGYVVESGPIEAIYDTPQHPYTRALLDSIPDIEVRESGVRRKVLAGQPPELGDISVGCPFASRCQYVRAECRMVTMDLEEVGADHYSACPFRPLSIVVRPLKSEAKNQ